jgi:hypothetical protein
LICRKGKSSPPPEAWAYLEDSKPFPEIRICKPGWLHAEDGGKVVLG